MLYRITDGTLAIGGENLLEHFDFEIKGRERLAITGPERFGQDNVVRLIAGELYLERDELQAGEGIYLARNVTIGNAAAAGFCRYLSYDSGRNDGTVSFKRYLGPGAL